MKKSIHVVEHTPIYDLDVYLQRQRQFKRQQLIKNLGYAVAYFCLLGFTFSMFFWGV